MPDKYIIDGKQDRKKRFLEYIITGAGWGYVVAGLIQTAATLTLWLFNLNYTAFLIRIDLHQALVTMLFTLLVAVGAFILLYIWHLYNRKKFGNLHRRKMPEAARPVQIAAILDIEPAAIEHLQNLKWIELESSIKKRKSDQP